MFREFNREINWNNSGLFGIDKLEEKRRKKKKKENAKEMEKGNGKENYNSFEFSYAKEKMNCVL